MPEHPSAITFPEDLPVSQHRQEIADLIAAHQVLVLCGETGSGKTTQLPKICLSLGRGQNGLIGHTQPRRIAARSVATRIAEELKVRLGGRVGFKMRFADHVGADCQIKLMTDGILLAELRADPKLRAYGTLIIDEAHERSLNIDFLLGYLKRLLPKRPDLKLIITSATLDPERIAAHFGQAPIYEVPGRSYPVEVRYRSVQGEAEAQPDRDLNQAIIDAVDELAAEGEGDVLVFLPGEREIREAAEALRKHHPRHTEILPLYARLSSAEQQRIFTRHVGRRVVLATNVAETALTVPGIRYVIDSGLARLARYAWRSRLQRLSLEPISQASAQQRAGRCGRLGPGICIRLYAEEDFDLRPMHTDPEILRSNLTSVVLQMAHLDLGDPQQFPFIDAPDPRLIRDAFKLLETLRAVDAQHRITRHGRRLARLPLDPSLAAMLLAADEQQALAEVSRIVALLAIQDPRERPAEKRQAADEAHAQWRVPGSDFLSYLSLWEAWQEQSRHLSQRKLRDWCKSHYLSFLRMRDWQDLLGQLRRYHGELGLKENTQPAEPAAIHKALLTGLINQVGVKTEKGDYLGARNRRFAIHPGSGLFKSNPAWLMAAEIAETTRVYARECAAIRPEWIESVAPHLLKHHYFEPHFQPRRGTVGGFDRITLHGLVVHPKKRINFATVDPQESRRVFIREGLVAGRLRSDSKALKHNQALIESIADLEAKGRRRDLLVDEQVLYDFYDARLPDSIVDAAHFEAWRKRIERDQPQFLILQRDALLQTEAPVDSQRDFPDVLEIAGLRLPLSYRFEPGHNADGVTLQIPLAALNGLPDDVGDWLVPGLLEEKLTALIKSLPKAIRKQFVPAPEFAKAALGRLGKPEGALLPALSQVLDAITGTAVAADQWRPEQLEPHLRMRFEVLSHEGKPLASGRDLAALKAQLSGQAQASFAEQRPSNWERDEISEWDFGTLKPWVDFDRHGATLRAYPALVDKQSSVSLVLADSPEKAQQLHRGGLRRLFMLGAREPVKYLSRQLPNIQQLCLRYAPIDRCEVLKEEIIFRAVEQVFMVQPWPVDADSFHARLDAGRGELVAVTGEVCALLDRVFEAYTQLRAQLKGSLPLSLIEAAADVQDQLAHLLYPGFLLQTPAHWLQQYPRYLQAMSRRLEKAEAAPDRDRRLRVELLPLWEDCKHRLAAYKDDVLDEQDAQQAALIAYRWRLEELRVSVFAQELGTQEKVSLKRLEADRQALSQAAK
ncbi:ATP-dependent helicase HrpA [Ectothiorhodosinus mongolicus]|uniref:ATP-dependent helicase HrpA n=1 Tax=Ectothiorhodosinus mongolicus TaxID=233100 RepID=A0A1R3VV06_9GAMM|nr:ATP-dependent RNA helicase HrpA [Ectothiorhodosinus mongolicus]ULX56892.1 ATP-dependent RNA helicase HrpA [Ectothiorhodosinus mongolicus]SIT68840.1 ATP-dependent helicase HrpA [Ectothiorhodosinus mongolicus]